VKYFQNRAGFPDAYGAWAMVAGASEGLGAAFARSLAGRGMNLVLAARRLPLLESLAGEIRGRFGVEVRCVRCDLAAPDCMDVLKGPLSGLEVGLLVYNAAYSPVGDFALMEPSDLMRVVDVNVRAPVALLRAVLPPMIAAYAAGSGERVSAWSPASRGPSARRGSRRRREETRPVPWIPKRSSKGRCARSTGGRW
jgi:short-subunit dehydrogenase